MISSKSKQKELYKSDGWDWVDAHTNGDRKVKKDCKKFFTRKRRRRLKRLRGKYEIQICEMA